MDKNIFEIETTYQVAFSFKNCYLLSYTKKMISTKPEKFPELLERILGALPLALVGLVVPGVAGVEVGVGDGQAHVERIHRINWVPAHRLSNGQHDK